MRRLVFCLLLGAGLQLGAETRPNIVVFLVDDMGVMDTSVPFLTDEKGEPKRYPLNDWFRTPNMERLAAAGIRFNNFYAQSVCSPSRSSLLTGQNATRHGITCWIKPDLHNKGQFGPADWNWTGLKEADVTLASVLKEAGYRTIHIGKAHLGSLGSEGEEPLNLGFDVNVGGHAWGSPGSYFGKEDFGAKTKRKRKNSVPHLEAYHGTETHLSEALTMEANKAITASVEEGKPFFLHLSHYAVHSPFQSDPRFAANYEKSSKSAREKAFATLVEGMDASLGGLLDHLKELGIAENTLVFFLGDNGSDNPVNDDVHSVASAAPLRGRKGTCYEGGMRVPFIAAWAKSGSGQEELPIAEGRLCSSMGTVMDLWPTIVEVAGAEKPVAHVLDGRSLKTQMGGQMYGRLSNRSFLMHFPHEHRSNYFTVLRKGEWKAIYRYLPKQNQPRYELFDLRNDPFEQSNLAKKEPKRLQAIMRAMAKQLDREGALYPVGSDGAELRVVIPLE